MAVVECDINDEPERLEEGLYRQISDSFAESLRRAMAVAGESDDGHPKRVTQHELSARARVARSSLAKYLAGGESANPDLKSLCRLADSLNVPPAFLLMRPDDWKRLAEAAFLLTNALRDSEIEALATGAASHKCSPIDRAKTALKVAKRIGLSSDPTKTASPKSVNSVEHEIDKLNDRRRLGVITTCALPPLGRMTASYNAVLLCLCASFGATTI
ncbi:helix-turn-helix domain-containing protein [Dyella monticola]|nr:helix-turn-helix transcriptional regulator [Dyella monticola]